MKSELPRVLGGSWGVFVADWHLGDDLGYTRAETMESLATLDRLWPEELIRVANGSARGLGTIVPVIELGLLIRECEHIPGFRSVFERLRSGERGAYSELVLGSTLRALGHTPRLEVSLNGRVLDAHCDVDGTPVYFEAVTPERPEQSVELQRRVDELIQAMRAITVDCRVEIALSAAPDAASIQEACDAAQRAPNGEWVEVSPDIRIRCIRMGERLSPIFDGDGAQVIFGGEREQQRRGTGIVVRWEDEDHRTKKLFNREYKHFSDGFANVLVVNVCGIPGGIKAWTECMERILRPDQNRKIGAIILFRQGIEGPPEAIRRGWKSIVNPFAHMPVPASLLIGFEALNGSPVSPSRSRI